MSNEYGRSAGMTEYWDRTWSGQTLPDEALDVWSVIDRQKAARLVAQAGAPGMAVEVGCGSARLAARLAAAGWTMTCLDRSLPALILAEQRFAREAVEGEFLRGDAFALPLRTDSIDLVMSTGLLEHFVDPGPILAEMVRVLRPCGLFYSDIVPAKFSLLRALDRMRRGVPDDFFERSLGKKDICELLKSAGLTDVDVRACGVFPPRVPLLDRFRVFRRMHAGLAQLTAPLSSRLDGTAVAEGLGVYYIATGIKPAAL